MISAGKSGIAPRAKTTKLLMLLPPTNNIISITSATQRVIEKLGSSKINKQIVPPTINTGNIVVNLVIDTNGPKTSSWKKNRKV